MKHRLRLALPPLAGLTPQSRIAFALFDRHGRLLRSGEQSLEQLATALPTRQAVAILHPGDAVVLMVDIPPLAAGRLDAAVQARVEPLALSDIQALCLAHGPRLADGRVQVAWTDRRLLLNAWQGLHDAGLDIQALLPFELALPEGDPRPDKPLTLPADARWQAPLPNWSLARPEWRPERHTHQWRRGLRWAAAAALLWVTGLHLHAAQLRGEIRLLQARTEHTVRAAFPSVPILLDPLRQTQGQLDQLRLTHGLSTHDDFMPLSRDAAEVLGFAAGHVASLQYRDQQLTLTLAEGYTPPADETALQRSAATAGLLLNKDTELAHVWHIRRDDGIAGRGRP